MSQSVHGDTSLCPCGTGRSYDECCGPHLSGARRPTTAEELMRSRYTAYTKGDVDYIVATHDPEHADRLDREATEEWAKEATWLGLDILACEQGQPGDETGTVEFVARYEQRGSERAHHERSTFRNVDGAWFFRDGDLVKPQPLKRAQPKVGRNEPCPCGSGKKYKKCCGSPSA